MTSSSDPSKILARAIMYLMQTAAKDGIISEDEAELIKSFEISLKKYERALQQAYEDGIITSSEEARLQSVKEMIIDNGRVTADMIDGISKDEMNLLISMMLSLEVPRRTEET